MQVTTETTLADTAGLTPENYRSQLGAIADAKVSHMLAASADFDRQMSKADRAIQGAQKMMRVYRGRPVLVPGKRKAARHPWADRLRAARTGGFVVDQSHPDTNLVVGSCYACGDRFGFIYGDPEGQAEFEARAKRHQLIELVDGVGRECTREVTP